MSRPGRRMRRARRRPPGYWTAVHEAGHAVALALSGRSVHQLSVVRDGSSRGHMTGLFASGERLRFELGWRGDFAVAQAEADAVVLAAGGAAERVRDGRNPTSSREVQRWAAAYARDADFPRVLAMANVEDLMALAVRARESEAARADFSRVCVLRPGGDGSDLLGVLDLALVLHEHGSVPDPMAWLLERREKARRVMGLPEVAALVDLVAQALLRERELDGEKVHELMETLMAYDAMEALGRAEGLVAW